MINYSDLNNLANLGLNNQDISQSLGISTRKFYILQKKDAQFAQAVKEGKQQFKNTIRQSIINKANKDRDTTMLIYLSKKLTLFGNDFDRTTLKTPVDGLKAINEIYQANIPIEDKKAYISIVDSFIKTYEANELEQRLSALESKTNI
jgi:hypothetical protein